MYTRPPFPPLRPGIEAICTCDWSLTGYQDVSSPPHLPSEVNSEPQEATHSLSEFFSIVSTKIHFPSSLGLRGVEVVASTSVVLTNSLTTFDWSGHGLKLTVPLDSLPAGVDQCRLDIVASTTGQYHFPDTLQLVSGVFWVRPGVPGLFRQVLTVEVQHCAKMSSSTKLSFVRAHCSQENLPYRFKEVEGRGSFTEHSSYSSLEVTHFSGLAIAADSPIDLLYVSSLYYLKPNSRTIEIYFTINQDEETHNTVSCGLFCMMTFYDNFRNWVYISTLWRQKNILL